MRKHILAPVALAAAGLLLLSACASGDDTTAPAPAPAPAANGGEEAAAELSGTILIDGSSTVGPFAEAAAELFMNSVGGAVAVTVGISGTGGGFEKFCTGETDGSNASRDIKDEEVDRCAENGIEFGRITVANDALSVIVNNDNPLECISVEALSAIWQSGSTVSTWGQTGLEVGDLAGSSIELYGPGTDSGTFDFFTDEINGESGNIRTDYINIGEDDNLAVQGVAGNSAAMAFIPYSFYQEYAGQVKGLSIDNGNGCVAPETENLFDGSYTPLGRALYMFPSAAALQRPEVVAFYTYVIEANEEIAAASGVVPLTAAQRTEQLAVVAGLGG